MSNSNIEDRLFDILLRKSFPDLQQLQSESSECHFESFVNLMKMQGDSSVIERARKALPDDEEIAHSLDQLQTVVMRLEKTQPQLTLHIDLADVLGYQYHTGLKFSAFVDGEGRAIAKGGRYDRIGERFGHARPATGFSADLKALLSLCN